MTWWKPIDGQEALAVLGQRHIDVIITDLCMEPMDGVEFTRRLRTPRNGLNPYVPMLMVSAHADIAQVKEAVAAGVTEFLAKPIIPADLGIAPAGHCPRAEKADQLEDLLRARPPPLESAQRPSAPGERQDRTRPFPDSPKRKAHRMLRDAGLFL